MSTWVSVKVRLPEVIEHPDEVEEYRPYFDGGETEEEMAAESTYSEEVLVWIPSEKRMTVTVLDRSGSWRDPCGSPDGLEVTHWHPLPSSPAS